ncbi:hypothetical protein [Enterococcus casseliflavus]|uniref:hypothetical protein n=1 Tax=Enterococcus casseliflavus TaxID=37734 RepID=UPI003DA4F209
MFLVPRINSVFFRKRACFLLLYNVSAHIADTKHWMSDSHHSHPDVFLQTAKEMEAFRRALLELLEK